MLNVVTDPVSLTPICKVHEHAHCSQAEQSVRRSVNIRLLFILSFFLFDVDVAWRHKESVRCSGVGVT